MEGRDPPVSGECPAPSQNQPAVVRGSPKPAGSEYGKPAGRGSPKPSASSSPTHPRARSSPAPSSASPSKAPCSVRVSRAAPRVRASSAPPSARSSPYFTQGNFGGGGSRAPAEEAWAGAGATASEAVPPWPPESPDAPWVLERAPPWRPSVLSPCLLAPSFPAHSDNIYIYIYINIFICS